ncbi:sulfofructose kinase [Hoeflea marina]|uniref:Sulfofructose kinase n=1 Tax=Hoeflea marina TaxID=274592 RepID=A0A317PK55_9HYPH|nr:PfkB family carbohydrate kinase [Hoeflea marina]PWW00266.1 sulfofructose kinase [Hoeflea marina]
MSAFPPRDPNEMPHVACIGLSALDYIWTVPRLADEGKMRADSFATKGGGMAATAAVAVARLGGHARFLGRAGADPEGRFMRDALEAERVDVSAFRLFEDGRSSISSVWVDRTGERRIVNFRGSGLPSDAGWLPLADIGRCGAVLSDPRWPEGTEAAFAAARAAGIPTVLDADMADADIFERLLPLTDHAIFSEPALHAFAGPEDPLARVAAHGCRVTAVTRGGQGVDWIEAGERHHADAFPVAAIDTTGAGDVFHGAYAFAIAARADSREAMSFAAAAAALKCTRPDGRSGIPNLQDTIQLWRSRL